MIDVQKMSPDAERIDFEAEAAAFKLKLAEVAPGGRPIAENLGAVYSDRRQPHVRFLSGILGETPASQEPGVPA